MWRSICTLTVCCIFTSLRRNCAQHVLIQTTFIVDYIIISKKQQTSVILQRKQVLEGNGFEMNWKLFRYNLYWLETTRRYCWSTNLPFLHIGDRYRYCLSCNLRDHNLTTIWGERQTHHVQNFEQNKVENGLHGRPSMIFPSNPLTHEVFRWLHTQTYDRTVVIFLGVSTGHARAPLHRQRTEEIPCHLFRRFSNRPIWKSGTGHLVEMCRLDLDWFQLVQVHVHLELIWRLAEVNGPA